MQMTGLIRGMTGKSTFELRWKASHYNYWQVDCAKRPDVGRMHYLPHHGVVRRDALTTKLRVVFDASSRPSSDSPSLNECRYSGPALTATIFNVLLRFRGSQWG